MCHDLAAAHDRAAGAPANEVEITPEMIEAGLKPLFNYDPDFSNEKDIVVEVFRAMLSVSTSHCRERL